MIPRARSPDLLSAGRRMEARMPMIAITTNNSMRGKPLEQKRLTLNRFVGLPGPLMVERSKFLTLLHSYAKNGPMSKLMGKPLIFEGFIKKRTHDDHLKTNEVENRKYLYANGK